MVDSVSVSVCQVTVLVIGYALTLQFFKDFENNGRLSGRDVHIDIGTLIKIVYGIFFSHFGTISITFKTLRGIMMPCSKGTAQK